MKKWVCLIIFSFFLFIHKTNKGCPMKLFSKTMSSMMVAVMSLSSVADTVTTSDGVNLKGKVLKIHKGVMVLKTDFAGEINVQMDKVTAIKTDEAVSIETGDKQRLTGVLDASAEKIMVNSENSSSELKQGDVNMMWMPGDHAPDFIEPVKKEWKFVASGDWSKKTGNTDEQTLGVDFTGILADDIETLKLYMRYYWSETNDVETDDELIGGIDYERRFGERSSWYARGEFEKDDFEGIDLRTTLAAGYGYYFLKEERLKLRGRIGGFSRYESYIDNTESTDTYGVDLGLRLDYQHKDNWGWYTDIVASPSVEDISECQATHESALVVPVGTTDWYIRFGVRHEYNSEAPVGKDNLDTTYFSRLEINF